MATYLKTKPRIALIDADSFIFAIACKAEMCAPKLGEEGEDLYFQVMSDEDCYEEFVRKIEELIEDSGADEAMICLSYSSRCFRYDILPTYKANRQFTRRPAPLAPLVSKIKDRKPWTVAAVKNLEADDVCGIMAGHIQAQGKKETLIVSKDKDLLQIPGLVYVPHVDGSTEIIEVTQESGDRMHLFQTLCGDSVDHYTGCPGIGKKRANAILDKCAHSSIPAQWEWVVQAFKNKGLTEEYALTQARVARILRASDWDAVKKEPILWEPR